MCTVTIVARKRGYILGMNRDEKLARPQGLPPRIIRMNYGSVMYPSEPAGGTWIAVNDTGHTYALINWYSVNARVSGNAVTRGLVVKSLASQTSPAVCAEMLKRLPLKQIQPFRLIGCFPTQRRIYEWRWDLKNLTPVIHPWGRATWISSGYDEPGAQQSRGDTFAAACRQASVGTLDWLRRLHRSHHPGCGPYSTCMHRADAATVSYTEVNVNKTDIKMLYHAGPPCSGGGSRTTTAILSNGHGK